MREEEQLTERITVRFTKRELSDFEKLAKREGDTKVSTFLRRMLYQYLSKQNEGPATTSRPIIEELIDAAESAAEKRKHAAHQDVVNAGHQMSQAAKKIRKSRS